MKKPIINIFTIVLLSLFATNSFSQTVGGRKAFINIDYINNYSFGYAGDLTGPAAGFGWQNKKGNWHEATLLAIGASRGNFLTGLRYQYSVNVLKRSNSNIKPFIGLGAEERFQYIKAERGPRDYKTFSNGISAYVSPGVQLNAKGGFYGSLQLPIDIFVLRNYSQPNQSSSYFNAFPFERLDLRIGFGYTF
ncbi:MAG: hypothetical protein EOP53_14315 [Sphingobacteriales bacterium]|nr:MAG: hypothetical protein EOP53_14315 [Sphingobacteriales bacterium]